MLVRKNVFNKVRKDSTKWYWSAAAAAVVIEVLNLYFDLVFQFRCERMKVLTNWASNFKIKQTERKGQIRNQKSTCCALITRRTVSSLVKFISLESVPLFMS